MKITTEGSLVSEAAELPEEGGSKEIGLSLSDGAHGEWDSIPAEVENQRQLASNPDCPLEQRLEAVYATGGWAAHASDKTMLSVTRTLRQREGLSVLPASTAGLIALVQQHNRQPFPGDRYVALLTGRNA